MRSNDVGEEDHLMAVDEIGISIGIEKPANSRVSFKDMLLGASSDTEKNMIEQDNDDLQLLDGDVTTGTEDGLPSIRFFDKSVLKSIEETIGHAIKLNVNTGSTQKGRFVHSCSSVSNRVPVLGEMNQENLILYENKKDSDMFRPWMMNQAINGESNPTDSAKLKGKGVAIYKNPLGEEGPTPRDSDEQIQDFGVPRSLVEEIAMGQGLDQEKWIRR
ncbi:hypothetical protein Gorai_006455 [Gossypium raimondii]|uniref:Uncharacterized protein n=1 Tax=Gossypium raimondii TaxID=29730 RepID=A0A7J8QG67_GOSRA|nr:hypothetical protein [Gossypium raimondii]